MKTILFYFQTLFLIFLLGLNFNVNAQVTITVGTLNSGGYNSSTSYPSGYFKYSASSHQQFLLTGIELQNAGVPAGQITALGFNVYSTNSCGALANYTINLKQTTASSIMTFDNTGLTQVYTTTSYTPFSGWNTHSFSTQFTWDGSSNILVDICNAISPNPAVNASTYYTSQSSYYSYVLGMNATVSQCGSSTVSNYGQVRPTVQLTVTPNPPSCAVLSSPANNAVSQSRSTTLSWTSGSNTTSYDVYFGTSSNPPFIGNITTTTYSPGTLLGNTDYYWKIIAKNSYGSATGCSTWKFTTNSGLVNCATNLTPADSSTNIQYKPTLSWTASTGATKYDIYLGTSTNPPLIDSTVNTSYVDNFLTVPNQTYYWRIAPKGSYEYNNTCSTQRFTIWSGCVSNQTPTNGSTNVVTYPTLTWSSVPTTISYYIYLGTNPNPPLFDSTSSTTYNAIDLIPNSLYYWKIVPRNSSGFAVGCPVLSFTTKDCNHWFVKTNGNDGLSGNCWNNAKQDLSLVLFSAVAGDTIHVAAGTYYPLRDTNNNNSPTDQRTYTFTLNPGVKLVGGYPTTASGADLQNSILIQPDPYNNITTLSGDIGAANDSTDNSYHVVFVRSGTGGTSLIDGFTITKGSSLGATSNCVLNQTYGGGIYIHDGNLYLKNSLVSYNYAKSNYSNNCDGLGGGIYSDSSKISVYNSIFLNNESDLNGTAIYIKAGTLNFKFSSIVNMLYPIPDAIHSIYHTNVLIDNSTLWNTSIGTGSSWDLYTDGSNVLITNSTIGYVYNASAIATIFNNSIIGNSTSALNNLNAIYSCVNNNYYNGAGIATLSIAYPNSWLDTLNYYGGHTPTKRLKLIGGINPAVGMGNPAYAGQPDQRGVIRSNTPSVGAYEASNYAQASDIVINDTIICSGTNVKLTATSNTIPNPSFKWYSNSNLTTLIDTSNTYTTPVLNTSAVYYLIVYNDTVFGNPIPYAKKVTVLVTSTINISQQPLSDSACVGKTFVFSISATGAGLTYQWKKNNVNIQGDTNSILTLNNITLADTGNYSCVVTNSCGSQLESNLASLFVSNPLSLLSQPQSASICENGNQLFSVNAEGIVLHYQWQKNGTNLSGQTNDTLLINNVALADSGNYSCRLMGLCGDTLFSNIANLEVIPNVKILQSPPSVTKCIGDNILFNVVAIGANLNYQWQKNGTNLPLQTNDTLLINNAVVSDSGTYTCNITGLCGGTLVSQPAYLYVSPNVSILQSPNDLTQCIGTSVLFSVEASGFNLGYQWQKNGVNLLGRTNDTLLINNVALSDSGMYTCNVSSLCGGTITCQPAKLTILPNVSIQQFPTNTTKCEGDNLVFNVIATGTNLSYQWQKNGTVISGQTGDTLIINNVALSDSGSYKCYVTGLCGGTISSQSAKLTVFPNVNILQSPTNITKCIGDNLLFNVSATGVNLSYHWQKDGIDLLGQTNDTLLINNVALSDSGFYTCNVTGLCGGTISSQPAKLTIISIPTIVGTISGPATICQGQNSVLYTFPAIANATSYIWVLPFGATGTSTTDSINVNYGASAATGYLTVMGQNVCGIGDTNILLITVNVLPTTLNAISTSFHEDFQNGMPASFTLYNDNNTVNSNISSYFPDAWDVLLETTGSTNMVAASPSWFTVVAQADRWMITSLIKPVATSQLSWRGASIDSLYLDGYMVKLSTTGLAKTDFTTTLFSTTGESKNWDIHNISLASYAGQSIYIAFIQNSTDDLAIMIDDIDVTPIYNPAVITGPSELCVGATNNQFSVTPLQNATSYVWTFPTGITGTGSSNTITVNVGTNAQSGLIKVRGQNSCGVSDSLTFEVTVNQIPPTPTISQAGNTLHSSATSGNQWYNAASGIISGATAQTYNPTANGYYYVIVTLNSCSSDSSNHVHYGSAGIETNENNNTIRVYPNPATDELIIETNFNTEQSFEIINMVGQAVYTSNINKKAKVNTSAFASGVYIIKLYTDKETVVRKFVKE